MKKVLLMIDDATVGGGQNHLLWLARGLDRYQFEVSVACEGQGYLVDELKKVGISVYPLSMSNCPNPRSLWQCVCLLRSLAPDILHTHGGTAGFFGRMSAILARVKTVIHTYHGIHYLHFERSLRKTFYTFVDRMLASRTHKIICVAQSDFDAGEKAGILNPDKTVIIRNGIDVQAYANAVSDQENASSNRKDYIIGTVGRLHVQKGHSYLLDAAKIVLQKNPQAQFQIVGDGELRGQLEEKAKALGISRNVLFLGSRMNVPVLLAQMDIFVLPSLWEGLPLVLLEAMASAKPIISTRVDGVSEILTDGENALLVSPKDPVSLASAIDSLIADEQKALQLARQAYKTVVSQFEIKQMVEKTAQLYQEALS